MKLRRLRVASLTLDHLELASAQAHYLRDVLRLAAGTWVEVFDGHGKAARALIARSDTSGVGLTLGERYGGESVAAVTVAMATPKGDRADWAVEKLTELGVTRIVWLSCERSVVVPREDGKRLERHRRIAEAAAGQSGRNDVPEIVAPMPFAEAVAEMGTGVIAHPGGDAIGRTLAARPELPLVCLIGPEGGFTGGELAKAEDAGYIRVSLARTILRSETAAVAAAVAMDNLGRGLP